MTDFLTGKRVNKDESDWMVVDRPDLRIIEPDVYEQAQHIKQARGRLTKWTRNVKATNTCFPPLLNVKNAAGPSSVPPVPSRTPMSAGAAQAENGRSGCNCPNTTKVDEDELIDVLQAYFAGLIKNKKNVIHYVVHEFERGL